MKHKMTCICCPMGCELNIDDTDPEHPAVSGNRCPRGAAYGREEMLDPKRTVTAVVHSNSGSVPYIPVRTDKPLAKALIPELLQQLYLKDVQVPVKNGDVLLANYRGTGINVIFTRTINQ